jgi:hypothetical protein
VTVLGFTITFHSPFRVGSSYARDGVDAALDRHDPLPADHIKGLMRACAADLLGLPPGQVGDVFGSHSEPSPWSWSSAHADGDWRFSFRHRVQIDPESHSARKDHLVLGEQAWQEHARFEVRRVGTLAQAATERHILILRCAAAGVHELGSWRRRGLGWVGINPDDGPVTTNDVAALLSLGGNRR